MKETCYRMWRVTRYIVADRFETAACGPFAVASASVPNRFFPNVMLYDLRNIRGGNDWFSRAI